MRTDQMVWVLRYAEEHLEDLTDSAFLLDGAVIDERREIEDELGLSADKLLEAVRGLRDGFEASLRRRNDRLDSLGYNVSFRHPLEPNRCAGCERPAATYEGLCAACLQKRDGRPGRCRQCAAPTAEPGELCERCRDQDTGGDRAVKE